MNMEKKEVSDSIIRTRINDAISAASGNRCRVAQMERAALCFINGTIPQRTGVHSTYPVWYDPTIPHELVYTDTAFRGDDKPAGYDTEITKQIRDCYRKDVECYNVKAVAITPPLLAGSQDEDLRALSKSTRVAEQMINNVLSSSSNYAVLAQTMESAIDFAVMVTTVDLLPLEGELKEWEDPADYVRLTSYRASNLVIDYTARTIDRMRYIGFLEQVPLSTVLVMYPDSIIATRNPNPPVDKKAIFVRYIDLDLGIDVIGVSQNGDASTDIGHVEILVKREPQFKNAHGKYVLPIACLTYSANPVHPLMGRSPLMENAASLQDIAKIESDMHQAIANYKDVTLVGSTTENVAAGTIQIDAQNTTTVAKNMVEDHNATPNFGFFTAQTGISMERITNLPMAVDLQRQWQTRVDAMYAKLGFTWNEVGRVTNATATEVKELKRHRSGQTTLLHSCLDRYITQLANVIRSALRQLLHPADFNKNSFPVDRWYTVGGKGQAYSPMIFAVPFDISSFKEGANLEETNARVNAMADTGQKILALQSTPVEGKLAVEMRTHLIGKMVEELGWMSAVEYAEKMEAEREEMAEQASLAQQTTATPIPESVDPNVITSEEEPVMPDTVPAM
jgi:hypothetical protein